MKQHGFTFIEILVSVTIIAVLLAIGVASYASVNRNARDAKRKSDLEQIRAALEQYRADNGSYPATGWQLSTSGSSWLTGLVPTYMDAVPVDPKNTGAGPTTNPYGYVYAYWSTNYCNNNSPGTEFILVANLESNQTQTTRYGTCDWSHADGVYAIGEK